MPQMNFSAPNNIKAHLKNTKPDGTSLSRYILDLVILGLTKCGKKPKK